VEISNINRCIEHTRYSFLLQFAGNPSVPLVIVLHGGGGNGFNAMKMTGFNDKAMQEGFIAVYPDGSGRLAKLLLTWNAQHCCAYAMRENVDDVGFISKLIDKLAAEYPIDTKRVYVTGMSNGALMSTRLALELPNKIAAIGPVVGTIFGDAKPPSSPVPAIMFNGLLDEHIPYRGGVGAKARDDAFDFSVDRLSVESQAAFWAKANGCTSPPTITEDATIRHIVYKCPAGKDVEMYVVKDQGHAWPGGHPGTPWGDAPSRAISATDVMWDFFKQQSL
jgi:polyhydroxybutyrate depolymerase